MKKQNIVKPTVYVIDDDEAIRDSLQLLLETSEQKINVETYVSAQAFLLNFDSTQPGCIVLDIRMPEISGPELQDKLISMGVDLPIIFITGHGEIPLAVDTLQKGAFDFIQKPFSAEKLIARIGNALLKNSQIREKKYEHEHIVERFKDLTKREHEVLDMLVEGRANKYIAYELGLSQRTVEAHRSHIMEKVNAASLAELVKLVIFKKNTVIQTPHDLSL